MNILAIDITSLIFGIISIFMSIAIEFPQLVTIFKTKNTSGTSLITYILFLIASFLWVAWAILNYAANVSWIPSSVTYQTLHIIALVPAIISNVINVVFVACILYFKIRNICICKKRKITEFEYSQILFDKQKNYKWIRKYYPLIIMALAGVIVCATAIVILYFIGIPKQISEEEYNNFAIVVLCVNIVAAVFFESISWPQFIKCMKTKDTSGISMGWAIFLPLSCIICLGYDISMAISVGWQSVLGSLICNGSIINTLVLILKIKNARAAKKLGISEWKYTKKYIVKKQKELNNAFKNNKD